MMPMERSIVNATRRRNRNSTGPEAREAATAVVAASRTSNSLPGGHSEWEPPDPIPNSEVKTLCADGSVPFRHARVGHRQASNQEPLRSKDLGGFFIACEWRQGSSSQSFEMQARASPRQDTSITPRAGAFYLSHA